MKEGFIMKVKIIKKHENGSYVALNSNGEIVLNSFCLSWLKESLLNYGYTEIEIN